MSKVSTKPPSGMRDFLPLDVARRQYVTSIVREVYAAHGFQEVETPTIENLSTLLGKYGDEGDQLLYRLLKRRDALKRVVDKAAEEKRPAQEADLAKEGLRYDLTVPLARLRAEYELPRFFKRFQIQPVWRADRPGKGRFREFYQCDVDITGTTSPVAEAEVCSAVCMVLDRLGFEDYEVQLNHRALLRSMIRFAGIDTAMESTALVAVDKLDKIGRDGVETELGERGISSESATMLLDLITEAGDDSSATLERLGAAGLDAAGQDALSNLGELLALTAGGAAGSRLRVEPALARGLSYYTGPIFEIRVPDFAGSLGGGGRYDDLIGMFGKERVPAVGFSIGLERILVVMADRAMYPALSTGPEVLLCWMDPGEAERAATMGHVLRVAAQLRAQGLRVEVYPEAAKFKKQMAYANAQGVEARFAGILGESELAAGTIALKNMETGEQQSVPVDQAASIVRAV